MDDVDPCWIGPVELDELAGLVISIRGQPARRVDDLLLSDDADVRLGRISLGELEVLHLGHRVHGMHERDAPALGREPPHLAAEPVMRVDEVVPALGSARLDAHDARGHGTQLTRKVLLDQSLEWTGRDVSDENSRGQLDR